MNTRVKDGDWRIEEDEDRAAEAALPGSSSILYLPSSILAFPLLT
jgi:hypothetical protein